MAHDAPNRRTFISSFVGGGLTLPLSNSEAVHERTSCPAQVNRPLGVTSKTNSFVREEVTGTAWDVIAAGGSAMDAAEKGTNVSELDPRDRTVGYGGDPNEDGFLQLDANGNIAGVTSTVGHHFKIVGRVGDSPIIGVGLYVDNDIGAAGATGHGAECVKVSASRIVVEKMREGLSPTAACRYVCERVASRHDGGSCVQDAMGHRMEAGEALLPPMTQEELDAIPWR